MAAGFISKLDLWIILSILALGSFIVVKAEVIGWTWGVTVSVLGLQYTFFKP